MAVFREDVDIYPLMVELLGCLAVELERSGLPTPCRISLMPGAQIVIDVGAGSEGCKDACGQAWVRLVNAFPSNDFPTPAVGLAQRCDIDLAYELEVGISRCEPSGKTVAGKYVPPTMQEQLDSVRLYTADMAAMRRAVLCCLRDAHADADDIEIALGLYQPFPSQGGSGGGGWQLFVRRI